MDEQTNDQATNVNYWYDANADTKSYDYTQLGERYRTLNEQSKKELAGNIINAINNISGPDKETATNLHLCHWFRMDIGLGIGIAKSLNTDLGDLMKNMPMG